MYIKRTPPLIFYRELSMNSFVKKNVKKKGREGWQKNDKKWPRGRIRDYKMWYHSLKKMRFCKWRSFWMTPMMMFYFAVFLWVYLLMILLAFCETNKPIYIKINIYYIYKTRYLQNYSIIACKESKEMN